LFGDYAFRRSSPFESGRRTPINRPLFDSWGYWLAKIGKKDWDKLVSDKSNFFEGYFVYIKSNEFDQISRHWSGQEITRLFDEIKEFIRGNRKNE
jgi:hypothetical protein